MKLPEDAEVFESPMSLMWFDEHGILCSVYKKGAILSKEALQKSFDFIKNRSHGKKICWLGDVTNLIGTDKESRDYSATETPSFVKALAILTKTPVSRIIANIYLALKKPPYPTKVFNDEEDAREWLMKYL